MQKCRRKPLKKKYGYMLLSVEILLLLGSIGIYILEVHCCQNDPLPSPYVKHTLSSQLSEQPEKTERIEKAENSRTTVCEESSKTQDEIYEKAFITYIFGEQTATLDVDTIRDQCSVSTDRSEIDMEALASHVQAYVANLALRHDTVGTVRSFTTSTGYVIQAGGGNYGWEINQAAEAAQLMEEIQTGQSVSREPIYSNTAMQSGPDDIGDSYVEVNLTEQHMYVYQEGVLIFETDIVSGDPRIAEKETPTGVFHLYTKTTNEILRGEKNNSGEYEYETPVQYWMPFDGGIGFHDADWQPGFGEGVNMYSGSHGCINMPTDKAAELYEIIDTKMPIIVFDL